MSYTKELSSALRTSVAALVDQSVDCMIEHLTRSEKFTADAFITPAAGPEVQLFGRHEKHRLMVECWLVNERPEWTVVATLSESGHLKEELVNLVSKKLDLDTAVDIRVCGYVNGLTNPLVDLEGNVRVGELHPGIDTDQPEAGRFVSSMIILEWM